MGFTVMFYVIAIVTLGSALMMVISKNIFHSALLMLVAFLGIAGVFVLLHADFLAATQVLIYAGAITIFVVFAIMFTMRGDMKTTNLFSKDLVPGALLSLIMIVVNAVMVLTTKWPLKDLIPPEATAKEIANLMLTKYVVAFELTAVLLLVAMLGAIVIVKGVKRSS
ncbi:MULTISPECIES: NADH-quinone oxidoreductase subunit J family protein [Dehalobacter]|jgi:NADH:ubiquinone oxidoreductase subunit 6 (chain J)|uniref:NADH-quinone oxidoreductase subunit J n=1 Tax=Dehalobacter restrictus TaxID=55583 RepID=A0A857DHQ1_9FIRM|nr:MULTISPECIES: NADH-quinone oxidoreductase subunit J [Dehalobacter]AFV03312.1 NADH-ubiquinone oxidoreductase chain J [Dehalobacter sp. DCA]AFV06300.1 NADH-ubiquinone oxidoreductase chain J [Dehalobacter sp. CF]EQB20054.1 NADH-ubiquinone oxidoreductase chain J [Dehalobacter sp. UNSWDHB]QHA00022.1 NADH-quinone oxidoreductase subunit J [Dehalobacter restrictus]